MFQHREKESGIKTLTISRKGTGKWYASFSVQQENTSFQSERTGNVVGIDAGLLHLAGHSRNHACGDRSTTRKGNSGQRSRKSAALVVGECHFTGAITAIIMIGFLLLFVAQIITAIAFFTNQDKIESRAATLQS